MPRRDNTKEEDRPYYHESDYPHSPEDKNPEERPRLDDVLDHQVCIDHAHAGWMDSDVEALGGFVSRIDRLKSVEKRIRDNGLPAPQSMSSDDIERLAEAIVADLSPSNARQVWNTAESVIRRAESWHLSEATRQTIDGMIPGGQDTERDGGYYAVSESEFERIREAAVENSTKHPIRDQLFILLMFYIGVRVGELVDIKVDNIDREEQTITIEDKGSKHSGRELAYPDRIEDGFKRWLDAGLREGDTAETVLNDPEKNGSQWLFPSNYHNDEDRHLTTYTAREVVTDAAETAGIQETVSSNSGDLNLNKVVSHSLRAGCATFLYDEGKGAIRSSLVAVKAELTPFNLLT